MTTQAEAKVTQEKAIVQWKGEAITITFRDVKSLICPLATDQETAVFLKTCQSLNLNPFASEIYLIKYSERDKAAMVIAIDSYLKAGEANPQFDGFESGIILKEPTGRLDFRDSAFLLEEERPRMVGGWAKVYRKDRSRPFYVAVNKKECLRYTRDGNLTQFWTEEKQPSMLRKVALKRSLVEAFPSLFAGAISNVEADYELLPEGELPPVLEKGGKPNWKKFWAKVKSELGLTTEEARLLLHVDSIKKELIDAGWTMEKLWDELVIALKLQKATEVKPEQAKAAEEDIFGEGKAGAAALAEAKTEQPTGAVAPAKPKRDPKAIKTIQELYKACHEDWGMQPKDVIKELGYSSQTDIAETPSECYQKIAAARQ